MIYRRLGKTNLLVSEIGLGGIPIQKNSQSEVDALIDALIKKGVSFIDTARGYTISEKLLGNALKGRRQHFVIATKSMARDYQTMKNDIQKSLDDLQTNYIDLYQCHFVRTKADYQKIMSEDGAFKALQEAKAVGKIHHFGMTSHDLDLMQELIGETPFETIQFPYNIIETRAESLFSKAKQLDIGVIVMKPMAGGAIDRGEISLKYILKNPNISVVIPGMTNLEEVEKNTLISGLADSFNPDELEYIAKLKTMDNTFCRRCGYCLPCPQGIDIPTLFLIEGYHERYQLKDWAISRYETQKNHASKCIACRVCESRCPYKLPISDKMKKIKTIFGK